MKSRRKALRLKHYDYSQTGGYFLTICTYNGKYLLAETIKGKMILNDAGERTKQCWFELKNRFTNIELDEFVIMPNYIHGIIIIMNNVGAIHELPLQNRIQRRRMLIPKIVGYFKMNAARHINQLRGISGFPVWQRNYYEHIIRSEKELHRIREYIQSNPINWEMDRENPLSKNFNLQHGLYWQEIYDMKTNSKDVQLKRSQTFD